MSPRTPFPISVWKKAVKKEDRQREAERRVTFEKSVKALKDFFKHKKVRKVYLVGSILQEGQFYSFSDVDIAVEGLEEDSLELGCALEHLLDRDVDLIELERCPFRDSVEKRGLRIR